MKTNFNSLFVSFAICGSMFMTSCSDEAKELVTVVEEQPQPQLQAVSLTMSLPEQDRTRTNIEDNDGLKISWKIAGEYTFDELVSKYGQEGEINLSNLETAGIISEAQKNAINNALNSSSINSNNWSSAKQYFPMRSGDKIGLYLNGAGNSPIPFEATFASTDSHSATFTGYATEGSYVAVYPYMEGKSIEEVKALTLKNQVQPSSGNPAHLENCDVMKTASFSIGLESNYPNITFNHQVAIMKLLVPAQDHLLAVSIKGAWGETEYEVAFGNRQSNATVTAYIAVPAGNLGATEINMFEASNTYSASKTFSATNIELGKMYKMEIPSAAFSAIPPTPEEYIDLGAAGIWKNMNEGANHPWEQGNKIDWNSASTTVGCPTKQQWQILKNNTICEVCRLHGVMGVKVTSVSNGNSVFFRTEEANEYWTKEEANEDSNSAYLASFSGSSITETYKLKTTLNYLRVSLENTTGQLVDIPENTLQW